MGQTNGAPLVCIREATVVELLSSTEEWTEALVVIDETKQRAVSFHALTGPIHVGDRVSLNTTAMTLSLGTGGVHFVTAVWGRHQDIDGPGHIMKCRYTPAQVRVLAVEEDDSPYRSDLNCIPDLFGCPVLVGTLHSQVPIAAATIKAFAPSARVVYVMTDGAALPAAFSKLIPQMKRAKLIDHVITTGHAFGGDLEAVTAVSGIAAARTAVCADAIIVAMGPGVVGTGTPLGTTAIEQGPLLDAVTALGGRGIPIVRVGFADYRARHVGISHHIMTSLTKLVHCHYEVPLPVDKDPMREQTLKRQAALLAAHGHTIRWLDGDSAYQKAKRILVANNITVTTMGKSDRDDPCFFHAVSAAAIPAVEAIKNKGKRG